MKVDAFTQGVEPGGLYNSEEIKILICYMLAGVKEPMPKQNIVEIIFGNGMANFFEINSAIDELIRLKNITRDREEEFLNLTDTGKQIAETLSRMIPYTLREKSVKAALQVMTRIRREQENTVTFEKLNQGYNITCTIEDVESPMASITLRVADKMQAEVIKENFLKDPILFYRSMMAVLTGNAKSSHNDTRINIDLK